MNNEINKIPNILYVGLTRASEKLIVFSNCYSH